MSLRAGLVSVLAFLSASGGGACSGGGGSSDGGSADGAVLDGRAIQLVCETDEQCADGRFCSGVERCAPDAPGADARGCLRGDLPCPDQRCDEAASACSPCDVSDQDGDGHDDIGCGGDDCIVTAGLLPPSCVPDANPVIWQFLNAFGEVPQWGDINDYEGYADVVSSALADVIVQTCDEITPVG